MPCYRPASGGNSKIIIFKTNQFKSMTPPKEANALIDFLTKLSTKISLPKYDRPRF